MSAKATLLFILLSCTNCIFAQEKFSFVFMSDIHYTDQFGAPKAFRKVIDTVNKINPDFVLVGGDMVYDALRKDRKQAVSYASSFLKEVSQINAPKYYAIGNHDIFSIYDSKADTTDALYSKRYYENYFGKRYYAFSHKGWHFITLDDIFITPDRKYFGRIDDEQLAWLRETLLNVNPQTPIVLMVHVPLITTLTQYYGNGTIANTNKIASENTKQVLNCFKGHNLKLVLQGHLHYFEALNIANKTTFITAPSVSGRWWLGKQNDVEEGFIKVNVNGDDFSFDYIDYQWEALERRKANSAPTD